jgi:hypothetical protein
MTVESLDEVVVLADAAGNVYELPREVLDRCRISRARRQASLEAVPGTRLAGEEVSRYVYTTDFWQWWNALWSTATASPSGPRVVDGQVGVTAGAGSSNEQRSWPW